MELVDSVGVRGGRERTSLSGLRPGSQGRTGPEVRGTLHLFVVRSGPTFKYPSETVTALSLRTKSGARRVSERLQPLIGRPAEVHHNLSLGTGEPALGPRPPRARIRHALRRARRSSAGILTIGRDSQSRSGTLPQSRKTRERDYTQVPLAQWLRVLGSWARTVLII
jgi:hypothetical protein